MTAGQTPEAYENRLNNTCWVGCVRIARHELANHIDAVGRHIRDALRRLMLNSFDFRFMAHPRPAPWKPECLLFGRRKVSLSIRVAGVTMPRLYRP
jgi:hypothetical protein